MTKTPQDVSRRAMIMGGALLFTGVAAFAATPRKVDQDFSRDDLGRLFPESISPWVGASAGLDVVPDIDNPKREQIFSRIYSAYGLAPITVVVSYHGPGTSDIKAHPAEVCYAACGFTIENLQAVDIDLGAARPVEAQAFTGRRQGRVEQVLYLTRVGRFFPRGMVEERRVVLDEALKGVRADGAVFRISVIDPSLASALPRLEQFARVFLQGSGASGRTAILGPGLLGSRPILKGPLQAGDSVGS